MGQKGRYALVLGSKEKDILGYNVHKLCLRSVLVQCVAQKILALVFHPHHYRSRIEKQGDEIVFFLRTHAQSAYKPEAHNAACNAYLVTSATEMSGM